MLKILFVCTGNTCRSPMAEAILKHKTNNLYEVKSAGVFAQEGRSASPHTIAILTKQSIPINHQSKQLDTKLVHWSDIILTMSASHKEIVVQQFPEARQKVYNLKEFAVNKIEDIADPYGGTYEDYEKTFQEIEEVITKLIQKLQDWDVHENK